VIAHVAGLPIEEALPFVVTTAALLVGALHTRLTRGRGASRQARSLVTRSATQHGLGDCGHVRIRCGVDVDDGDDRTPSVLADDRDRVRS
jgi:hypothetical protein